MGYRVKVKKKESDMTDPRGYGMPGEGEEEGV